jgi:octaprenyl-diphosphate synthase
MITKNNSIQIEAAHIFENYSKDLKKVEQQLLEIFESNVFLIPTIGKYILSGGGKRIRPLFLLLSSDLCGYKGEERFLFAAIIEAIHTASLLHDDVIDSAETRRGKATAHSLWGNQIVILMGDFLYSKALKLAVSRKNQKIMETLSAATTDMTEGEILQLNKIGSPEINEDEYFKIISSKTGVLVSAACRIAAILAQLPEDKENALASFGLKTGIAFQLTDDILDYTAEAKDLGKKLGKDIEEGKITLPMIYLLKVATDSERKEVKKIISESSVQGLHHNELKRLLELFSKYQIIEKSFETAQIIIDDAKSELHLFPDSEEKRALLIMADYAMLREK